MSDQAAATSNRRISGSAWLAFAQIPHLGLLLLPTYLSVEIGSVRAAVWIFAFAIALAAYLESIYVNDDLQASDSNVCDKPAMYVATIVGISLLVLFWIAQIETLRVGDRIVGTEIPGISLLGIGIGLRILAIRSLGESFVSDIRIGDEIVTSGIYRWMRHPSEVGLIAIAVGGPLLISAFWTACLALILLTPISVWRMRRENFAIERSLQADS